MTMKQVRFVKADSRNPVQEIAELAVFDASGKPVDPPTSGGGDVADNSVTTAKLADKAVTAAKIADNVLPTNATTAKAGLVKQATHVADPAGETPTKAEFIALRDALVTAGQMASA
mgnify:FL=1|jgi:hypothetical protein